MAGRRPVCMRLPARIRRNRTRGKQCLCLSDLRGLGQVEGYTEQRATKGRHSRPTDPLPVRHGSEQRSYKRDPRARAIRTHSDHIMRRGQAACRPPLTRLGDYHLSKGIPGGQPRPQDTLIAATPVGTQGWAGSIVNEAGRT